MKGYVFFSVHEELFGRVVEQLNGHVDSFSGFVWSRHQARAICERGMKYASLTIFTREYLPQHSDDREPDVAWLRKREREIGISIQRMIASERHMLTGKTHREIMRMAEVALRETANALDRARPDFLLSEDVACFHSYVHYALARERGIPFWAIAGARLPGRIHVYSAGMQRSERVEQLYPLLLERGLDREQRHEAEAFVERFRMAPTRPKGMEVRSKRVSVDISDLPRFKGAALRYLGDPGDPTMRSPRQIVRQRLHRIWQAAKARIQDVFQPPVPGEKFVLFPLQFQPEASTLVQGPMFVDQVALIRDLAKSIPVGFRLYVKEHLSSRGRRPSNFYSELREIPEVRLLGPDSDTWTLIRDAAAIAVITGTVGWEGLLFDKPVITFGDVFYNIVPSVYRAGQLPKDRWYEVLQQATSDHVAKPDEVLALVSAIQRASFPGRMANGLTFPEVLAPENVSRIAHAVVTALGLDAHAARGAT